ncbi:tetratricopeptide repeat protein [Acinetobacter colistiniresistens]|uniref:tetratricopeptide repeat protein n=2 Tax=Acinetobacter TaxID=469 RepID=UPI002FE295C3
MKIKYTLLLCFLFSSISIHAEVPNFELLNERVNKNEESTDDLYNLAMIYRYDQKSKDLGLAKYYMTIAADKDHPDALYELGMMFVLGGKVYKTDENGVSNTTVYWEKDIERGEYLLLDAASKNNVKALVYLGYEYILGYTLNQDIDLGISCLKKAAELGDQTSQLYLGNAYRYGNKVPKDISKGIYYMEMAAKQGSEEAILSLKNMKRS